MLKMKRLLVKGGKKARIMKPIILVLFAVVLSFALKGARFALLVLCAAAVHESGHLISAYVFKVPMTRAKGSLLGMWLSYDFSNKSYLTQIAVSCAGAAFNVICAGILTACAKPTVETVFFIFSNLALALFNLMPVSRFDGIGVIRCLLLTITRDAIKAERVCLFISGAFSLIFFVFTVYVQMRLGINLPMLVISVFLLLNSMSEGAFRIG